MIAFNSTPSHDAADPLPYGVGDLDTQVFPLPGAPQRVRCYVRGCDQVLRVSGTKNSGEVCPRHGIRVFHSASSSTYSYEDVKRNIIASPHDFVKHVVGHPFKFESHRLGLERSEDALTWNVFRSLQEAGQLGRLAETITGISSPVEPFLYVWGICSTNNDFDPWHLLIQARHRFESNLPVERPFTEPDAALFLPGRYLVLIEAKFTSRNTFYQDGPRKDAGSLTLDELRTIYHEPSLQIINHQKAHSARRIYQQLWRNLIFAEWMAREDHPGTKPFHVNLVRAGQDEQSAAEFSKLVNPEHADRFQRFTWERIHTLCTNQAPLGRLKRYLETKTAGLKRAFDLTSTGTAN